MNLKDQVCSLELAKKLKELGVKQKSLWWWVDGKVEKDKKSEREWKAEYDCPDINSTCRQDCSKCKYSSIINHEVYSAFTVAELGEMVSLWLGVYTVKEHWSDNKLWWNCYIPNYNQPLLASTEANARAKMLIYLIEKKLLIRNSNK